MTTYTYHYTAYRIDEGLVTHGIHNTQEPIKGSLSYQDLVNQLAHLLKTPTSNIVVSSLSVLGFDSSGVGEEKPVFLPEGFVSVKDRLPSNLNAYPVYLDTGQIINCWYSYTWGYWRSNATACEVRGVLGWNPDNS
jgi:hypothetical protein